MENVVQFHPLALAFVGDAVMGLIIKERIVADVKVNELHKTASRLISAKSQAILYDGLALTEREKEIANRAFNAKHHTVPKNCTLLEYRKATALEAVIGYNWLLKNYQRVEELLNDCGRT